MLIHYLEGVLVAKKDPNLPKHNEIDTKNLYVILPYPIHLLYSDLWTGRESMSVSDLARLLEDPVSSLFSLHPPQMISLKRGKVFMAMVLLHSHA